MPEEQKTPAFGLTRLWRCRRKFGGFGLLLFYCHMLMLFSVLARGAFGGAPEYAALTGLGKILVPALFTLTTLSLFRPFLFWIGLALGFLHLPAAAFFVLRGPAPAAPWLLGLSGLALLLLCALYVRARSRDALPSGPAVEGRARFFRL